jgi:hypothetical protein
MFLEKPGSAQLEILKWIALISMLCDHANRVLAGGEFLFLFEIGRLAFPLFAFLIAWNLENNTSDPWKYCLRLLFLFLLSERAYAWAFPQATTFNTLGTLFLGAGTEILIRNKDRLLPESFFKKALCLGVFVGIWIVLGFVVDYRHPGVLLIPAFSLAIRENKTGIWIFLTLFLATLGIETCPVGGWAAVLSIPLIFSIHRVSATCPRLPQILWYAFYPAHLFILVLVRILCF